MKITEQLTNLWRKAKEISAGRADFSNWLNTQAVVFSSQAACEGRQWNAHVWYDYHLEKEHWSGSCTMSFADQESAQAYVAARPPGSKIQIRYCPGDPGRSAMFEKDQPDPDPLTVVAQSPDF